MVVGGGGGGRAAGREVGCWLGGWSVFCLNGFGCYSGYQLICLSVQTLPALDVSSPRWNVNNGGCCQTPAVNPDVDRGLELLSRRVPAEKAGRLQLPSPVASTALDGAKTRVALAGTHLIGPRISIHLVTRRRKRQFVDGKRRMSPTQGNHARVCQQQGGPFAPLDPWDSGR
jgi:hypothetical protein